MCSRSRRPARRLTLRPTLTSRSRITWVSAFFVGLRRSHDPLHTSDGMIQTNTAAGCVLRISWEAGKNNNHLDLGILLLQRWNE